MVRTVVLLCGPPGAGKTTAARASGLTVYDRDEYDSERSFTAALYVLALDPDAQAVVIRWAPSSEDRARTASLVRATHVLLVVADRDELARRIARRGRADSMRTLAALNRWFGRHDRTDGVQEFAGWSFLQAGPPASRSW